MNFRKFIDAYLGKEIDYDGHYKGQCVDLFRQYCRDVLELTAQPKGVTGAADFWLNYDRDPVLKTAFEKIPNSPLGVPHFGDVILWNKRTGQGFGHVAVFIEGDVLRFTSLDQNWPSLSVVTRTPHNYVNVLGWLRPKDQAKIFEFNPAVPEKE